MCEASVYLRQDEGEELVLADVCLLRPEGGGRVLLRNIFGEQRVVKGRIVAADLASHRILIEEGE